jgi:sugar lactone lactonase YvrE
MKQFFKLLGVSAFALLLWSGSGFSQNLFNGPESVAFDSLHNRYLVSNYYDGSIVQVDPDGNQSYFYTGLGHCLGNTIINNTIYVAGADSVVLGIDLSTAQVVDVFGLTVYNHVDGVTTDTSGYLYVVDTGGRILKVNLATGDYSVFVSSGLTPGLQDIIFDRENNRLLAVSYYQNAPIQAIDLSDSSVYVVVNTSFGNFDGITRDQFGNTYVATYSNSGSIYRYDPEFALGPELISSGLSGLLRNYPNPFNAYTVIEFSLDVPQNVILEIYDILGRRIETLSNSDYQAGTHRVTWETNDTPSGIYYCRIGSNENVLVRKITLLK